jgi:hypothetical protein
MPLNEDIFGGNSKPHRDRGGIDFKHFDARLALAPRHLRVKHFPSCGSKIMIWQRDCESFSNFQCCVLEIALEPKRVRATKTTPCKSSCVLSSRLNKDICKKAQSSSCRKPFKNSSKAAIQEIVQRATGSHGASL